MDRSFGIIPLRKSKDRWETFLVQLHAGHWGFPKGHLEAGEDEKEGASRELFEETGLRVKAFLDFEPIQEFYTFELHEKTIEKTVSYYLAEVEGDVHLQEEEVQDGKWVPLQYARSQMTFVEGKRVAEKALSLCLGTY